MFKKLKFNGRITHKGNFCTCTRKIYKDKHSVMVVNTTVERLDNTEYKALLYTLTIEEKRQVDKVYINRGYTVVGYVVTSIVLIDGEHKSEYIFDKFNSAAMS